MQPLAEQALVDQVARVAATQAHVEPASVSGRTHLASDLGFDSLDVLDFLMTLEQRFRVWLSNRDLADVRTVEQAAGLIRRAQLA